jgi:hypothetical protein
MRGCRPHAVASSVDEVDELKMVFDERNELRDLVSLISALCRSAERSLVEEGLARLRQLPDDIEEEYRATVSFLTVLALFRLHKDDEALEAGERAKSRGQATKETKDILARILKERSDDDLAIGIVAGVGAAVLAGVLLIGTALFSSRRRKK